MKVLLFSIVCILFFIGIPVAFIWSRNTEKKSQQYGPANLNPGQPNIQGTLIWNSGTKTHYEQGRSYDHELKLVQVSTDHGYELTGRFDGVNAPHTVYPYTVEIYLSYKQGNLEGRYTITNSRKSYMTTVVHGVLGSKEAFLFFGLPKEDKKHSNQLRVQFNEGRLHWQARRGKIYETALSESGQLTLTENRLSGQIIDYRKWGNMHLDVSHQNEKPELAWIATLLCCDKILATQIHLR